MYHEGINNKSLQSFYNNSVWARDSQHGSFGGGGGGAGKLR